MTRMFRSAAAAALLVFSTAVGVEAQALKIGYVNTQRLIAETPEAVSAQRTLETEMARYQAQVDSMGRSIEQQRTDLERQQSTLSAAVRQQRQNALQQRVQAFQQQVTQIDQTAQRRRAELVQPVMQRINAVIEQVRKEGSYSIIFDAQASGLLAADPALDITNTVLARLKQPAPGAR